MNKKNDPNSPNTDHRSNHCAPPQNNGQSEDPLPAPSLRRRPRSRSSHQARQGHCGSTVSQLWQCKAQSNRCRSPTYLRCLSRYVFTMPGEGSHSTVEANPEMAGPIYVSIAWACLYLLFTSMVSATKRSNNPTKRVSEQVCATRN